MRQTDAESEKSPSCAETENQKFAVTVFKNVRQYSRFNLKCILQFLFQLDRMFMRIGNLQV